MARIDELYDRVNSALAAEAAKREKTLVGMSNARVGHKQRVDAKRSARVPKKERGLFDDDSVYARMQDTPEGQRGSYENQLPEPQEAPRADSSKKSAFNDSLSMEDVDAVVAARKSTDPQDVTRIVGSKNPANTSRDVEMIIAAKEDPRLYDIVDDISSFEPSPSESPAPKVSAQANKAQEEDPYRGTDPWASDAPPPVSLGAKRLNALFKTATGSSYDPNSRVDRQRATELERLIASRPELSDASDTKIALAWYKSKRK